MTSATLQEEPTLTPASAVGRRLARRRIASRTIGEARPMLWLTGVEGGARLLSFGFYLIAARIFEPRGFGVVQYTITVSMLAFGGLQVLATAVMRELGAVRTDRAGTQEVLGSSLAVAFGLWAVTSVLCLLAQQVGIATGASTLGLMVALAGTAAFQMYYAVARGLGHPGRQAASYAGASLAQLVMVAAVALLAHPSPTGVLVIYGASSFVPVVVYEWKWPVLRGQGLRVSRSIVGRLWLLAAPLLLAQVCYLIWNSVDQLWVQGTLGTSQIGLYASAKNLSQALLVVPAGVSGVLLPRVSQLRSVGKPNDARRLIVWGTTGAVALSALIALVIAVFRVPLLDDLYGHSYRGAADALAALSLGMVCYAGFTSLTMAAIGWGRASVYTAGIAVAAVVEALMLTLSSRQDLMTAAVAYSASMAAALVFVVVLLRARPLRERER